MVGHHGHRPADQAIRRPLRPDPTRREIPGRLSTGEATVNELVAPCDSSMQAISKHLEVLEHSGLISRGRDAQYRPSRFEGTQLNPAIEWIEQHRQVWSDRFDQLSFARVWDAPRELVSACMTTPEHLTHFWGLVGVSTRIENITLDRRPRGSSRPSWSTTPTTPTTRHGASASR
jgi:DNA-binding transcriptional ArsR family regulator